MTGKALNPGHDFKAEPSANEGPDDAVKCFESDGYVIVPSLVRRQVVERMRRAFYDLRSTEALAGSRSSIWIQNVLEKRADVAWLTASHPFVVRLLERLMGPFVQIESVVLAGFPPVPEDQAGAVSAWHRDRLFGLLPQDGVYCRPNVIVSMTYLQEQTRSVGPLRILPGSHLLVGAIGPEGKHQPAPGEVLLTTQPGDCILLHGNLLHSGTSNVSGDDRVMFGVTYNLTWMRQEDAFDGEACQSLMSSARERGDHRHMRLLGEDRKLSRRLNSGAVVPGATEWAAWCAEDDADLLGATS
jgi:hypothetical protein